MTEVKGTQGQHVERHGGEGNPTCRKHGDGGNLTQRQRVERHGGGGNPMSTCRKTRRRREPNANVFNDAEAEGTQRQRVERRGGGGTQRQSVEDTEAKETQHQSVKRRGGEG